MDKFTLLRGPSTKDGTFGVLYIDGKPVCLSLEEEWLNNEKLKSCIPEGRYKVKAYSGTKYKNVWILEGTAPRQAILIHWGNTNDNTAGCILMGKYFAKFGSKPGVADSVATIEMLRKTLPKEFTLHITSKV